MCKIPLCLSCLYSYPRLNRFSRLNMICSNKVEVRSCRMYQPNKFIEGLPRDVRHLLKRTNSSPRMIVVLKVISQPVLPPSGGAPVGVTTNVARQGQQQRHRVASRWYKNH